MESEEVSPVHAFVADHGQGVAKSEIDHVTIAGRDTAIASDVTADERAVIEDSIRAVEPAEKECFANSLRLWKHNPRFHYVEGFATRADLDVGGFEHAWCLLDGEKLVDPTTPLDHYHGVEIDDTAVLQRYVEEYPEEGIIGNHRNRFEFLREQGYVK